MASEAKLKVIAENAKLAYLHSVFTSELLKETEDMVAIRNKFSDVSNQLNFVLSLNVKELTNS